MENAKENLNDRHDTLRDTDPGYLKSNKEAEWHILQTVSKARSPKRQITPQILFYASEAVPALHSPQLTVYLHNAMHTQCKTSQFQTLMYHTTDVIIQ